MAAADPSETRYRSTVRVLVLLASFLAFLAIFTGWIDRQALDTDEWVDTSGKLLEDREISNALALYAVDQLYANVEVDAVLKQRLPQDLQPISAPVAAGIRQFATRAAEQALRSERAFGALALIGSIVSPPDGTRQAVLTLVLIALSAAGLEALSRKTHQEFPGAERGDWMLGMRQRAREASAEAGRRIGSAIRGLTEEERHPDDAKLDRLERLGELKEKGVLTAAEFRAEKKRVLENGAVPAARSPAPARTHRG